MQMFKAYADEAAAKTTDTVIDSEYSYIQTFINFLKQIVDIIGGIFDKLMSYGKK